MPWLLWMLMMRVWWGTKRPFWARPWLEEVSSSPLPAILYYNVHVHCTMYIHSLHNVHVHRTMYMFTVQCTYIHCTMYMFTAQCTCSLHNVHVHCAMYMFTAQCTWSLHNVHVHRTMYMFTAQCTCSLYNVHVHCIMYMFTAQCTCSLHNVHVHCTSTSSSGRLVLHPLTFHDCSWCSQLFPSKICSLKSSIICCKYEYKCLCLVCWGQNSIHPVEI